VGLRKVNTIGLRQANKCMQLSAIAYNLKKYLKFTQNRVKNGAGMFALFFKVHNDLKSGVYVILKTLHSSNLQRI
ncbi:hypothetical protein, partial [Mesonia mobilis]|uniref:hypothetical protein n=1 Tax=Mesonia mobilis TaxID=369791 RepID=UPI001969DD35